MGISVSLIHALKMYLLLSASQCCFSTFKQTLQMPMKGIGKKTFQSSHGPEFHTNSAVPQVDRRKPALQLLHSFRRLLHSNRAAFVVVLPRFLQRCPLLTYKQQRGGGHKEGSSRVTGTCTFPSCFCSWREGADVLTYTTPGTCIFHPKNQAGLCSDSFLRSKEQSLFPNTLPQRRTI